MPDKKPSSLAPNSAGASTTRQTSVDDSLDVALAGLSQAYAHALAIAFEDEVAAQRRRGQLAEAALGQAIKTMDGATPEELVKKIETATKAIQPLNAPNLETMKTYSAMTTAYRDAVIALQDAKGSKKPLSPSD